MPRILIVDDEPHVIRVLRLMLEREGYQVESAPNGIEALKKLAATRPAVMITDVQMPELGGQGLCEAARSLYSTEPFLILVMTSMTAIEERHWAKKLTNVDFLEKPLSPRQLVVRLANYFAEMKTRSVEASHG